MNVFQIKLVIWIFTITYTPYYVANCKADSTQSFAAISSKAGL